MAWGQKKKGTKVTLGPEWLDPNSHYPADEPPKPLQVDAVMGLIKQRNTFVMTGTGFGKSRISQMYWKLFSQSQKLKSLRSHYALGDNQVKGKVGQGYTAINLRKFTFTAKAASDIKKGKYNFIFLNNQRFTNLFHNTSFQDCLAMILVNEAHLLYGWGMVKSRKAKKSSTHKRHGDQAIFQPLDTGTSTFSDLLAPGAGGHPEQPEDPHKNIDILRAELTRPKIRILQFPMECSLKSVKDLTEMFGKKEDVVTTLIYSETQNTTLEVMKVNWKRVRRVIQIGQGNPSCVAQIIGCCGHNGQSGLAIMFVQPKRRSGLNTLEAIAKVDRTMDDVHGYIPMNCDDLNYLHKQNREIDKGFPACRCSNCAPEEAALLQANMMKLKVSNFEDLLDHPDNLTHKLLLTTNAPLKKSHPAQVSEAEKLSPALDHLAATLVGEFNTFFFKTYKNVQSFLPCKLFGFLEANYIAEGFDSTKGTKDIRDLMGGELMDGQLDMLYKCVLY
ncbi:hypothetical protein MJO28_008377 [Puccinia striiformis f. sp. tritici]|uniref:Uncharacterized protein n=1 Tax=Puccinia striiformis f. sp. tritici TaxID=168172 RepID=A0ACC0EBZ8_9BASI|nr:hypothetical protein MJO28_008377 [Puccinia striiformis f. sp. tritici]